MALATIVAGAYTATYAAAAMGQQEDGFRLRMSFAKEEIRSNTYGDSVIESIYRGGNCFLSGIFIERTSVFALAAVSPFNPYGAAPGFMGLVGRNEFPSSSALTKAIVLTGITGLSSQAIIATLTATNAIIDQNLNTEVTFANRASFLGLTFRLYPYTDTDIKWFAVA